MRETASPSIATVMTAGAVRYQHHLNRNVSEMLNVASSAGTLTANLLLTKTGTPAESTGI